MTGGDVPCLRSNGLRQFNCRPRLTTAGTLGVLGPEGVVQHPKVVLGGEVHHPVERNAEIDRESALRVVVESGSMRPRIATVDDELIEPDDTVTDARDDTVC